MSALQIPKTIRWMGALALILLVVMGVYRWLVVGLLMGGNLPAADTSRIWWLGLRMDARVVGFVVLVGLLIGWIPGLHPYKRTAGKWVGRVYFTLAGLVLLLFYGGDILHLVALKERLDGEVMLEMFRGSFRSKEFWRQAPVFPVSAGIAIALWLWWLVVGWLHRVIGKKHGTDDKGMRRFWQIMLLLLCLLALYGSFDSQPLKAADAIQSIQSPKGRQMALNPLHSFGINVKQ